MRINHWLNSVAEAGSVLLFRRTSLESEQSKPRDIAQICAALYSHKGEALGTALACEVVDTYAAMDEAGKLAFFKLLLDDYSVDSRALSKCIEEYRRSGDSAALLSLSEAVEAPRQQLFRRINMAPNGTRTIVNMRADLLGMLKAHPELEVVDADMKHLLSSWFNRGFLQLKAIDWRTPAHLLEKLIAYEAVHRMDGWDDLRRRLEDDRRCFAFFHPALPDEPLIFVEVALVNGFASAVHHLLAPRQGQDEKADTAIFYSISNCQEGLKGISFGNFLIKQVVMELQSELPQLTQFATLSPIPGFRRWLDKELANDASQIIGDSERLVIQLLQEEGWHRRSDLSDALETVLMRLCAHYLYRAKRGDQPLDPVARFHLGNGARLERLNWLGDVSVNGLKQSAGILVNYRYDLDSVEENHESFINLGTVTISDDIKNSLKKGML